MSKIKSRVITKEYAEGFDRTFGDRLPQRGRWIYDRRLSRLVRAEDYRAPDSSDAKHAPIMCDRYMEGVRATDGTDIGSRRKRRDYMKQNSLADYDDFKGQVGKPQAEAERRERADTREAIARAIYTLNKP